MNLATLSLALAAVSAGGAGQAPAPFQLRSSFDAKGTIPTRFTCDGDDRSPALGWRGVPEGTKSFAILMEDPEGRGGAGVHHWVAYGIPASVTSFAEGEVSKTSDKYIGGKSTQGVGNYSGPCTPPGTPHHYTFVIIATDLDPKELAPGLTREEFLAKLVPPAPAMSHAKGTAGLVGLFVKPN